MLEAAAGVTVPLPPLGVIDPLELFILRSMRLEENGLLLLPLWPFILCIRYAAVCSAVAAAARLAAWFFACANFVAQSGLIRSVVTTSGALTAYEVFFRFGVPGTGREEVEDVFEPWDKCDCCWMPYGCV